MTIDELATALDPLRPLTLCSATDDNHGRAVARTAKLLGFAARIFVPAGTAEARITAIEGEGATVGVVDGTYDDAVAHSAEVAAADPDGRTLVVSDTSWEGYQLVPRWVIEGYTTVFDEIDEALAAAGERTPDVVVIQIGVGALAAAAVARYGDDAAAGRVRLLGVEPTSADCMLASARAGHPVDVSGPHHSIMAGLNCGAPSLLAFPSVAGTFAAFVGIDDSRACGAMRELDRYGIEAGETGGAGLGGVRAVLSGSPTSPGHSASGPMPRCCSSAPRAPPTRWPTSRSSATRRPAPPRSPPDTPASGAAGRAGRLGPRDDGEVSYDPVLADRIRELVPFEADHTETAMFGGLAFLVGGNMAVVASGQGGVMVHVDPTESERLRRSKGVEPMVMKGRPMAGWLRVDDEHVRTTRQLSRWVGIGLAYAG